MFKQEYILKIWILLGILFFYCFLNLNLINAQSQILPQKNNSNTKSYQYNSIVVNVTVNKDSTFDVEERQIFDYSGDFHQAFRSIPFNKIDDITDISVTDGETGNPLSYSVFKLNKESSSSWGKFTHYREKGNQYIEWYYNLSNTQHSWIVKYKIHGGIEFDKDYDRLYWNIFSAYDAPVKKIDVSVVLPDKVDQNSTKIYSYRDKGKNPINQIFNPISNTFSFESTDFAKFESFTIDVAWPKGIVNQTYFWFDFIRIYYGYIFSPLILLSCIIYGFIFWLFGEKLKKGRGTIIPQYEPPDNLRPAMAEVITTDRISNRVLPATVVDLAVRGFLKIKEDKTGDSILGSLFLNFSDFSFLRFFHLTILILAIFVSIIRFSQSGDLSVNIFGINLGITTLLASLIATFILIFIILYITRKPEYILALQKDYKNDSNLEGYEKRFLKILFGDKDNFSTKELKKSSTTQKREYYEKIQSLQDQIYHETATDTKAFEVDPTKDTAKWVILVGLLFICIMPLVFLMSTEVLFKQFFILLLALFFSLGCLWAFMRFDPRLSQRGRILKEDWMGFKMYLETAEKYRLQKLTPETFEKYLPYAMIFGVEKKWAKSFESLNISSPTWYTGGHVSHGSFGSTGMSGSSFSPMGFSSSFSSSFASSFGSSGAGGGAGGGSAGGGGGGGGGGAS